MTSFSAWPALQNRKLQFPYSLNQTFHYSFRQTINLTKWIYIVDPVREICLGSVSDPVQDLLIEGFWRLNHWMSNGCRNFLIRRSWSLSNQDLSIHVLKESRRLRWHIQMEITTLSCKRLHTVNANESIVSLRLPNPLGCCIEKHPYILRSIGVPLKSLRAEF